MQRRLITFAAAYGLACGLLAFYYTSSPNFRRIETRSSYGGDFFQEWLGGRLVNRGNLAPHYDPMQAANIQQDAEIAGFVWDKRRYFPIVYPPYYYVMVSPLSRLPYTTAAKVWAIGMVACYVMAAVFLSFLMQHLLAARWQRWTVMIVPGGLLFPPVAESLVMNQKGTLCLLLMTATYYAVSRGRPFLAGSCWGWLLFKPQLALPVICIMMWKRQWHFAAGCLGVVCLYFLVGLVAGWEAYRQFILFVVQTPDFIYNTGYSLSQSHCVDSFFHGIFPGFPRIARGATVMTSAMIVAVALRMMRGQIRFDSERFKLQFSGLIVATILLSPHLYGYDLSVLLIVFVLVLHSVWRLRDKFIGRVAVYLVASLFCLSGLSELLARMTGFQISVVLLLSLLGVISLLTGLTRISPNREPVVATRVQGACGVTIGH